MSGQDALEWSQLLPCVGSLLSLETENTEGEREREMKGGREAIACLSLKRILLVDKPAMEYNRKHHILGFRFIQVYSALVGVERFGCSLEIPFRCSDIAFIRKHHMHASHTSACVSYVLLFRCSAIAFIRKHHMHPAHISFLSSVFFSQTVSKMKVKERKHRYREASRPGSDVM